MGKYLDILRQGRTQEGGADQPKPPLAYATKETKETKGISTVQAEALLPISETPYVSSVAFVASAHGGLEARSLARVLAALEARCPAYVEVGRWQQAVEDGRRFLAQWAKQAEALGWTAADLFGLHEVPTNPRPSYRRLSRYDCTGLCWLLQGRPVIALTETTAAIENPTGNVTPYRRHNKPAYGPVGDSLEDFTA